MIGKIFLNKNYGIIYRVSYHNPISTLCTGVVIKSNSPYFSIGSAHFFYFGLSTELTEEQFNKIMVFE